MTSLDSYYIFYPSLLYNWPEVCHWILIHLKNKILIEKEDSKEQHPHISLIMLV